MTYGYGIPFDRIVAYAFDADYHCVDDTVRKHGTNDDMDTDTTDRNGVPYEAKDSEGNDVHAVFTGDMDGRSVECCGDCGTIICMCCGETDSKRKRPTSRRSGAKCGNCGTEWFTDDNS